MKAGDKIIIDGKELTIQSITPVDLDYNLVPLENAPALSVWFTNGQHTLFVQSKEPEKV